VVCLREARELAARRARRLAIGFCVSAFATCGALLGARSLRAPLTAARTPVTLLTAEPPTGAAPASPQPLDHPDAPPARVAAADEAARDALPSAPAASAAPSAAVSTSPSTVAVADPAPIRQPTSEEVQAAYHATPVLMFSTNWCPVCARARQFFNANGLKFEDRDVDADPQASAELKRRSGGKAIPLIDIDGQQLRPGFSERATMQAVVASVERRLGITGVRFTITSAPN
jgi:glutaredoxin 3